MSSQMSDKMTTLYRDTVEYVASYNSMLAAERRQRPEHWDAYTAIRQRPCQLWQRPGDRQLCHGSGRVYAYPTRPWRVKKGWTQVMVRESTVTVRPAATKPANPYQTRSADRPRTIYVEENTTDESDFEERAHSEADFINEGSSDSESFRASSRRPSRRSVPNGHTAESRIVPEENVLVINCNMCGRICKTTQGLILHLNSYPSHRQAHPEMVEQPQQQPSEAEPSSHEATPSVHEDDKTVALAEISQSKAKPNGYCDFCLGTAAENKKTNKPETLVSCGDCGRSGHPSCLQFTAELVANVQQYHWQCIECKSCGVCGSSDNDDQLLFCDDCDRGYHMFCLLPPITEPPEGKWSCVICLEAVKRTPVQSSRQRKRRGRPRRR